MKTPFKWDSYSDQPYPIKDKAYKKKMRKKYIFDNIILVLTNIVMLPVSLFFMFFLKGKENPEKRDFFGMGVSLEKGDIQRELIDELGVKHLLIRMPLWEIARVDEYVEFAKSFADDKQILLNILQDREHIEDKKLLEKDIETIFEKFANFVSEYQLGNAINRTKWGFFSMSEYMNWYKVIQQVRDKKYPNLKLIGSSVIDFEYHYTIRTLFNFFDIKYDKFSALLYVDRRGAPQNTQMGVFDTRNKIKFLYSLVKLSHKTSSSIYITETNWPLSNTAPYAPTSELECVSEEDYAKFMRDYMYIAKESKMIERVYWHQLVAAGYGLVDDRDGKIRKTIAYEEFRKMLAR